MERWAMWNETKANEEISHEHRKKAHQIREKNSILVERHDRQMESSHMTDPAISFSFILIHPLFNSKKKPTPKLSSAK